MPNETYIYFRNNDFYFSRLDNVCHTYVVTIQLMMLMCLCSRLTSKHASNTHTPQHIFFLLGRLWCSPSIYFMWLSTRPNGIEFPTSCLFFLLLQSTLTCLMFFRFGFSNGKIISFLFFTLPFSLLLSFAFYSAKKRIFFLCSLNLNWCRHVLKWLHHGILGCNIEKQWIRKNALFFYLFCLKAIAYWHAIQIKYNENKYEKRKRTKK